MEGFLLEKRSEERQGLFSSGKKFKQRWCVLQGDLFTMYEDFDKKKQKVKGVPKSHFHVSNLHCKIVINQSEKDEPTHKHCLEFAPIEGAESELATSPGLHQGTQATFNFQSVEIWLYRSYLIQC